MRLIDWTIGNLGNQDRSLKATAVAPPPPPVDCSGGGPAEVCEGGTVTLTSPCSGGVPPLSWEWRKQGNSTILSTSSTLTINNATLGDAGFYEVKVTDSASPTPQVGNGLVNLTVNPKPAAAIDASGPTSFCAGGSVTLTAKPDGLSYLWSTGATTQSIMVTESGTYSVTVTDGKNCAAMASRQVTVNPLPEIMASPDQVLTCKAPTAKLSSDAPNIINPQFKWTTADGHIVSGADTNMAVVDMAGTYKVTVTDLDTGCSADKTVKVTENKTPPDANAGADKSLDCLTGRVTLAGSSATSNADFLWTTSDGHIVSGENTATAIVDKPGTYTLTVTDPVNGCTKSDDVVVAPCPAVRYCTLTQGAYGSSGGKFMGMGTSDMIRSLLASELIVGIKGAGERSLTIQQNASDCIILRLSAGGTPAALPMGYGEQTLSPLNCQTSPTLPVDSKGKFRNVLLGQDITLSLNARFDSIFAVPDLDVLAVCRYLITAPAVTGPDGKPKPADPGPDTNLDGIPDNYQLFTIPSSVLTAIGKPVVTVQDIIALANRALAGESVAASLSDINAAVDTINRAFDNCRFLVYCSDKLPQP